ncbi:MAG TPA: aminodeoxychorismate/anthranilate synthase component II [Candidatus Saccharimonadales bacterium]|nr:aminodeoxychorismate/anthranilate synthase component II [Candidatus Saccharimonadales bacterium]
MTGRRPRRHGPRILVIDNYDSFTWNLVQYLRELGAETVVRRNDRVEIDEIAGGGYDGLLLSPGPGRPEAAGITEAAVRSLGGVIPILGVCLGHQAIAQAAGARIIRAPAPVHGKVSRIRHDGRSLFRGLPDPFEATRYHSLVVDPETLPAELEISATTEEGLVMGIRRRNGAGAPLEGVQFHPESILTVDGRRLLGNFLEAVSVRLPAD